MTEKETMSFYDSYIADGEVLGAFVTLLLILIPTIAIMAYDKWKARRTLRG